MLNLHAFFTVKGYTSKLAGTTDPWFLFALGTIWMMTNLDDYILSAEGIQCRYLFIPFRRVRWDKINDAVVLNEWNDMGSIRKETVLVISLKPCLPYAEKLFSVFSHWIRNPLHVIFMHIPKELEEPLVQALSVHLSPEQFRDRRFVV